jgi:hypothetical protein
MQQQWLLSKKYMEQEAINQKHKVKKQPSGILIQGTINGAKKLLPAPTDEDKEYENKEST